MYSFYLEVVSTHGALYTIMSAAPGFSMMDGIKRIHMRAIENVYCRRLCEKIENCVRQKMCEILRYCCCKYHILQLMQINPIATNYI